MQRPPAYQECSQRATLPTKYIAKRLPLQVLAAWQHLMLKNSWTKTNKSNGAKKPPIFKLMSALPFLSDELIFPPLDTALDDPSGLLAAGGDLSAERLIEAYRHGIFPWFDDNQPILWWSPDPRCVVFTEDFTPSKSLKKAIRKQSFHVTIDTAFKDVIEACAAPRAYSEDTWITEDMKTAYCRLHHQGFAHSFECWQNDTLVGGLYGVSLGDIFFGESMFSRATNASKIAFVYLVEHCKQLGFPLIDCQVTNNHLLSLGAIEIDRKDFKLLLEKHIPSHPPFTQFRGNWSLKV